MFARGNNNYDNSNANNNGLFKGSLAPVSDYGDINWVQLVRVRAWSESEFRVDVYVYLRYTKNEYPVPPVWVLMRE